MLEKGWTPEVYVRNPFGRIGFLDLYDDCTSSYYEVKSEGAAYTDSTNEQMDRYDKTALINGQPVARSLKRGIEDVQGYFDYGAYCISYGLEEPGLIVYHVTPGRTSTEAAAAPYPIISPKKEKAQHLPVPIIIVPSAGNCGGGGWWYNSLHPIMA